MGGTKNISPEKKAIPCDCELLTARSPNGSEKLLNLTQAGVD